MEKRLSLIEEIRASEIPVTREEFNRFLKEMDRANGKTIAAWAKELEAAGVPMVSDR